MNSHVILNTGARLPRIGLGLYLARPESAHRAALLPSIRGGVGVSARAAALAALRVGYRHLDTASIYQNEEDVGNAIRESGIPRAQIFVTTKLWNEDQGHDSALRALDASLARLRLDYVDLFLLHWPVQGKRLESWRALETLHAAGRARAIGVSNFLVAHLTELLAQAKVVPAVNQIEVSPYLQQRDLREFCAARKIIVEAYSPLTKGRRLGHPVVVRVAREAACTPAQVMLAWGLAHGLVVLPKSTDQVRIAENFAASAVRLTAAQMAELDGLEEGLATGWDPRRQP